MRSGNRDHHGRPHSVPEHAEQAEEANEDGMAYTVEDAPCPTLRLCGRWWRERGRPRPTVVKRLPGGFDGLEQLRHGFRIKRAAPPLAVFDQLLGLPDLEHLRTVQSGDALDPSATDGRPRLADQQHRGPRTLGTEARLVHLDSARRPRPGRRPGPAPAGRPAPDSADRSPRASARARGRVRGAGEGRRGRRSRTLPEPGHRWRAVRRGTALPSIAHPIPRGRPRRRRRAEDRRRGRFGRSRCAVPGCCRRRAAVRPFRAPG